MSSHRGEIPSNTNAKTIGRRPTKQPQTINNKPWHRFPIPISKISKRFGFSDEHPNANNELNSVLFCCCCGGGEERNDVNNNGKHSFSNESYFDSFPAGYRFRPLDEELVVHYLRKKVMKEALPPNRINEINIYKYSPDQLAEKYKRHGEKEMYFFTPRDKKYPNGSRPNRAAEHGYWKASGVDKSIKFKEEVVGFKKTLVFYRGKFSEGEKTNWIMHEFRVNDPPPRTKMGSNDMRLDDWVLCRIHKKPCKSLKSSKAQEDTNGPVLNLECDNNVVANSRVHAINQVISQSEKSETPHFSNNPLYSMADIDELLNPDFGVSLEMLEPLPIFTTGSNNHPTNELSWSSISMELQDDIWSSFTYQENSGFDPK